MTRRRIHHEDRHAHFVTFACYRRRRLLDHDGAKRRVLGAFNAQLSRLSGKCIGFVLMPDHVHAIVWFANPCDVSECMKQWKRVSSLRIREFFGRSLSEYAVSLAETPVWQAKYYDFNLYRSEKIEEKLNYMHENPVRAGLVQRAVDWPWSSARYYLLGQSVGVPVGWLE